MSWRAGVVRRAAEEEARGGVDVTALAQTVLRALPPPPASRACDELLVRTTRAHTDVSRMLLATLFLVSITRTLSLKLLFHRRRRGKRGSPRQDEYNYEGSLKSS